MRADILPPPQYLIETELTVYQLADQVLSGNGEKEYHRAELRLLDLRKQFEDGQAGWDKQLPAVTELDKEIRANLLKRNAKLCRRYFELVFKEFLPAARSGDKVQMGLTLRGPMLDTANQHRAAINDLTKLTDKSSQLEESLAAGVVAGRLRIAVGLVVTLVLIAFVSASLVIQSITRPLDAAIAALDKFAEGDLTASANTKAGGELGKMCAALNRAIASLREVIGGAVSSAQTLGAFSETLSAVSVTVSAGVNQQVNALKETASNISLIAELSANNSSGTNQGIDAAMRTRTAADSGADIAKAAITGMQEIQETSAQIAQIVDTVDELSFFTNLLAVNAAVEAARAGEQGRGFMIVAHEIRMLAQRTAKTAGRIRELVEKSKSVIAEGAGRVEQSSQSFSIVSTAVRELSAIMEDVASSISVQSESLKQVNDSVTGVAHAVDKSNWGTEKIGATSKELAAEARSIQQLVEFFKF